MYDHVGQFTPLVPSAVSLTRLGAKAEQVIEHASAIASSAHPATLDAIRALVRSMNSYYSNRIEGQGTHPANIERALAKDFSADPDIARRQRLAVAHIEAEQDVERFCEEHNPFSVSIAAVAHRSIYSRLSEDDRTGPDGVIVEGGKYRMTDVQVGQHVAPAWQSVPQFLEAWSRAYASRHLDRERLVLAACAHHRLAWIHPFIDGNGRAARLQTHAALLPITKGLWSVNRGLARNVDAYYQALAHADTLRQGDHDGRGNLSERALVDWADLFLDICLDQVIFQRKMLSLESVKSRIAALITYVGVHNPKVRKEAILPVHHIFVAGPLSRSEFSQMTGLGERTARYLISELIKEDILRSENHRAPLHVSFALKHLRFLLPNLYPEASTDNLEAEGLPGSKVDRAHRGSDTQER